ncbi:MAG: DUF177 domain-containing protein [Gemmatimonadetes bacterium]|nr:DUF177 domain-containing protein [Gemmatimonadota bacterium]
MEKSSGGKNTPQPGRRSNFGKTHLRLSLKALRHQPKRVALVLGSPGRLLGQLPPAVQAVSLDLTADKGAGGVNARGTVTVRAPAVCRRCLNPLTLLETGEMSAWFRPASNVGPEADGVWPVDPGTQAIDLAPAIREEVWLLYPEFAECGGDCQGLCPGCGVKLADATCSCPLPEPDPRWAALRGRSTGSDHQPGVAQD